MPPSPKANPRNANGHRRRQLVKRVKAEEDTCGICGGPVDKTLTYLPGRHGPRCAGNCTGCVPHPMRAEVDEIVPVSLGGSPYERSNTRLTHRDCNRARGNGTKQTKTTAPPIVASSIW